MNWNDESNQFLRENYISKGQNYCANHFDTTTAAIRHQASRLGLKRRGEGRAARIVEVGEGYKAVSEYGKRQRIHRKVMEEKLGRKLESWEIVHHKDEDKTNNDPDNLELKTRKSHMEEHNKTRKRNNKGKFASS